MGEARQLFLESGISIELQMPPVAREPPVADGDDMPLGRLFKVYDQIDAAVVCALDVAAAEDHLSLPINGSGLPGSEAKRHQHRVEDLAGQVGSRGCSTRRLDSEPTAWNPIFAGS